MAAYRMGMVALVLGISSAAAWAGAVSPTSPALVSPAGATQTSIAASDRELVFEDATTTGEKAIVLRDAQGHVIRELDLGEFLPAAYVQALPRNEHGLFWRRESKLVDAQDSVEFSVPTPGSEVGANGPALRFSIDLRDGSVRTSQIREYIDAADQARELASR